MALNRSDKSRILRRYFPGMTHNSEMSTEPSFWSAPERSMWMSCPACWVVHKRAFVTLGHNSLPSACSGVGHKGIVQ